jgi:hypothetical protein
MMIPTWSLYKVADLLSPALLPLDRRFFAELNISEAAMLLRQRIVQYGFEGVRYHGVKQGGDLRVGYFQVAHDDPNAQPRAIVENPRRRFTSP